jgi:hypothetical protein
VAVGRVLGGGVVEFGVDRHDETIVLRMGSGVAGSSRATCQASRRPGWLTRETTERSDVSPPEVGGHDPIRDGSTASTVRMYAIGGTHFVFASVAGVVPTA